MWVLHIYHVSRRVVNVWFIFLTLIWGKIPSHNIDSCYGTGDEREEKELGSWSERLEEREWEREQKKEVSNFYFLTASVRFFQQQNYSPISNTFLNPSLEGSFPAFSPKHGQYFHLTKKTRWKITIITNLLGSQKHHCFRMIAVRVCSMPSYIQNAFTIMH